MAPHPCPNCKRLLHFEARICPQCGFTLGYDPDADQFLFLGDGLAHWIDGDGKRHEVAVCRNNDDHAVCNWLVGTSDWTPLCRACRHNRTIPDLNEPSVPERWGKIEAAKRRLFHTLIQLGLPLETRSERPDGLAFDFLYDADAERAGKPTIMTGHDGGVITLNLIEADDAERERIRTSMGEPYRTLLGHFRHEVGHYFWDRLIDGTPEVEKFREIFGDERVDYSKALKKHYEEGHAWTTEHVSFYAASHPWEDWAETFAHLLHMIDALATIGGFGMTMEQPADSEGTTEVALNPYRASAHRLIDLWRPFSFAENAISRSMGHPDLYPFHISPEIEQKLDYVRQILARARTDAASQAKEAELVR
jgi:hypothetical protein